MLRTPGTIIEVKLSKDLTINALIIKEYPYGVLVFAQDRLCIINNKGVCIDTLDIIRWVDPINF
jgi:hypothetical protein